jgi:hypothetical protein
MLLAAAASLPLDALLAHYRTIASSGGRESGRSSRLPR